MVGELTCWYRDTALQRLRITHSHPLYIAIFAYGVLLVLFHMLKRRDNLHFSFFFFPFQINDYSVTEVG